MVGGFMGEGLVVGHCRQRAGIGDSGGLESQNFQFLP